MPISQLPIFSMLRTRMQWHQERQRLLAENVANADTPKFKPRDLAPPDLDRMKPAAVALAQTSSTHLASSTASGPVQFQLDRRGAFETRPAGNVKYPNINPLIEMTDMREAQRNYEANINVIGATRRMIQRTLDILKA
jgi:flagellar basal-body rod protein FlgB